ncbi:MAG: ferric reductase-like transmembrane domain-containing protein [Microgenomates group bacterium]
MAGIISIIAFSLLPFLYLFTQINTVGNFTYGFANIAGFIGATLLFWEFILGIKELAKRIAPNPAVFIKLHIILGVWGMFFVLIHPILEMLVYLENITYLFLPKFSSSFDTHVTLGRIAFLLAILVWITSSFFRNNLSYKKWINIHYLSYLMMFFVFFHALDIGSFLTKFIFIRIYWFLLLFTYMILVMWRIIYAVKVFKTKYSDINNR